MGATYTRQSSAGIVDGGVIEASDINNEFDQLLAAFVAASGHTHDGTTAEGGPVTKLLGTAITIGDGTSGTDIAVTFDGESADGVLTWMEDEDYFKFSDDILVNSTEKLMFQDTGTYIYSNADGDLDVVSDGTAIDSINLESAGGITLDAGTAGSGVAYEDDGTEMLRIYNSSSDVYIESKVSDKDILIRGNDGGSAVTALTFDMSAAGKATFGTDVVVSGDLTISGDDLTMGTNTSGMLLVADGTNFNPVAVSGDVTMASNGAVTIASTAVESSMLAGSIADSKLSTISTADKVAGGAIQIDSGTDGTSITLADTDKFLVDDGGTTKYINASQLNTYTSAAVALDDISTGDAAVTLATSSGNITVDAQAGDADIIFKGTDSSSDITALTLDMSAAGEAIFNAGVVIADAGNIGSASDKDAIAISSAGVVSLSATTEASATGTAALTLAGGLGVAKDVWIGDDVVLDSDSAVLKFGDDQEITLTHEADVGLKLKHTATADDKPIVLTLQTGETDLAQDDVIGKIAFQAPDESQGTDAVLISAAIQARAEGDHSSSSNASSIDFMTGASEAATKKLSITSAGHFIPGTDNTYDIGTSSLEFKDGYFDGTLHCDVLDLNGTEHTTIEDPTALAIALG